MKVVIILAIIAFSLSDQMDDYNRHFGLQNVLGNLTNGDGSTFPLCDSFLKAHTQSTKNQYWSDTKFNANNCKRMGVSGGYTHCCRIKLKKSRRWSCWPLTDDQYTNINKYIEILSNFQTEDQAETPYINFTEGIKIKCSSQYLSYGILGLIALFLF